MVIWITGMSASGKTTLSKAISALVKELIPNHVLVDGDAVRELYGNDLDYSESSRVIQINRLRNLARFLSNQGQLVIVAALYSHPKLLSENREIFKSNYFEVYLKADMDLLKERDKKGLYSSASESAASNVVGIDIPWHPPENPDYLIQSSNKILPEVLAKELLQVIPQLQSIFK